MKASMFVVEAQAADLRSDRAVSPPDSLGAPACPMPPKKKGGIVVLDTTTGKVKNAGKQVTKAVAKAEKKAKIAKKIERKAAKKAAKSKDEDADDQDLEAILDKVGSVSSKPVLLIEMHVGSRCAKTGRVRTKSPKNSSKARLVSVRTLLSSLALAETLYGASAVNSSVKTIKLYVSSFIVKR